MTITSFDNLGDWFRAQQRGDDVAAHWNLYGTRFGETEKRVAFNTSIDDKEESFRYLTQNIRSLNNPDGSVFRLQVFPRGKQNNPTGTIYVQIFEKSQAPANTAAAAGVAGLPAGVGSIQEYVADKLETERLKWEIAQLKDQLNAPATGWERMVDTIGAIPGIDKVLQAIVVGVVSKFSPQAMPAIQTAMNGTPDTGEQDHDDQVEGDPTQVFMSNINEASQALGTDPLTLSRKLNALIQAQPELARQLISQ